MKSLKAIFNVFFSILWMTVVLCWLPGCNITPMTQNEEKIDSKKIDVKPLPIDLFAYLDGTGSYEYDELARETLCGRVRRLPPGSRITVRWITGNSFDDAFSILRDELPALPQVSGNEFDAKARKTLRIWKQIYATKVNSLCEAVKTAKSPGSGMTDINGAVLRFVRHQETTEADGRTPVLMILSDLRDNMGRRVPKELDLKGAEIHVLAFQEKTPTGMYEKWKKRFEGWKAGKVRFGYAGEVN